MYISKMLPSYHPIFTILVAVVLLHDIVIISIIAIITLMIYFYMKFLSLIPMLKKVFVLARAYDLHMYIFYLVTNNHVNN